MPQSPQQSDYLKTTLQQSTTLTDDQRQQMWDTFHQAKDQGDFVQRVNKLSWMGDDAKQSLYELRYKPEKWMTQSGQPIPPSQQGAAPVSTPQQTGFVPLKRLTDLAPPQKGSSPSGINFDQIEDRITGEMIPHALATADQVLNQPIGKTLFGIPSLSESAAKMRAAIAPPVQGGTAGMTADAKRIALTTGAGLGDYLQSPAGVAGEFLTIATGGAAGPAIAGAYAVDSGTHTYQQYQNYQKNPTPENLQNVLQSSAMTTLMASGATHATPMAVDPAITLDRSRMARDMVAPTPEPTQPPVVPRGAGTSAVQLVDQPPAISKEADIQAHSGEIARMQRVLDSPGVPADEKAYARQAMQASIEQRDVLQRPDSRAAITEKQPNVLAPKVGPEIAPEPIQNNLESLAPEHQEIAQRIEEQSPAPSAGVAPEETANRKMVEDLGGVWKGSDQLGLSHFDAPEALLGRKDVTISVPTDKLSPDYIKAQFDRKAAEFAPKPLPATEDVMPRLNTLMENNFKQLVDLKNAREAARDDNAKQLIEEQIKGSLARVSQIQDLRMQAVGVDGLQALRDEHFQRSDWYKSRAEGINKLQDLTERNAKTAEQISQDRATQPQAEAINPETGEAMALEQGAPMRPLSRSIFDLLQNRKPRYTLDDLQVNQPKEGVTPEEWKTFTDGMMTDLKTRYASIVRDISIHQDVGGGADLEDTDIPDRMKELDADASMIGQFDKHLREQKRAGIRVDVGRRPHLEPPVNADGTIKDPAALWKMDGATWARIKGSKSTSRSIPEATEVRQFARDQAAFGQLHDMARAHVDQTLNPLRATARQVLDNMQPAANPEAGFAGERAPESYEIPSVDEILKRAKSAGIDVVTNITRDGKTPNYGWLAPDGKSALDLHEVMHVGAAGQILPELGNGFAAQTAMLDAGWIRKASHQYFEVGELTDKTVDTIETDTILSGRHGHSLIVDTKGDQGNIQPLSIDREWQDGSLKKAIKQAKARQRWLEPQPHVIDLSDEAGRVPGAVNLGAASIGAVGGHIVGLHAGGPVGALIGAVSGFTLGYISPELIRSRFVQRAFSAMEPVLKAAGIDAKSWVMGYKAPDAILPEMKDIIDQQRRDPEGSGLGFLERMSQLPTDARRYLFNKFAILDDQRTPGLTSMLSKYDPRIPVGARPSVDASPYVSLADAAGQISGRKDFNIIQFSSIYHDAMQAGLDTHLMEYLNLKGYKRVFDVMEERVRNGVAQLKQIDQKLQDPKLSMKDRVGLQSDRDTVKQDANEAWNKLSGKVEAVPGGYTPQSINDGFQKLAQTLGPDAMQKIDGWAQQVFKYGRQSLDMAHDNGVVSDAVYKKLIARGDEYINMSRIMSDLADNYSRFDKLGKASPMYVSKQNIIRNLEGSERVNQNPLKANMMINNEMMSEAIRNKVVGEFVQTATANPDMYGDSFKKVGPNYKPLKGEAIVTHYVDGKPQLYKVGEDVYQALQGAAPINHDIVSKAMQSFYNVFRAGATGLNLGFQLAALPTDIMRPRILSDVKISGNWMKFGRLWGKNLVGSLTKSPEWQEAIQQGYLFSGLQRLITPEMKLETASLGVGQKIAKFRLLSAAEDLAAARADAVKMTTFQMLREQGYSEKAARYETKRYGGMPDYSQSGDLHPAIRLATVFFNADLQHLGQTMSRLADKPERILPILGSLTAMTMALSTWNYSHKDEDGQPLMRRVPADERDRNFIILTGGTHPTSSGSYTPNRLSVRKPDIIMYTINPVENALNKAIGFENRKAIEIAADAIKGLTPFSHGSITAEHPVRDAARSIGGSINPLVRVPLEEAANKQFGTGSPIVSRPSIAPQYQATAGTPSVYQQMGQATGTSPQRLQHIAGGLTGGLADAVAQQMDPYVRQGAAGPLKGTQGARRQLPVIGQAAARLTGGNVDAVEQQATTKFYDRLEQTKEAQQTFDYLKKSNPQKAQEFLQSNRNLISTSGFTNRAAIQLGKLAQMRSEIQTNPNISDEDKTKQLANIAKARITYMNAYNEALDRVLSQGANK